MAAVVFAYGECGYLNGARAQAPVAPSVLPTAPPQTAPSSQPPSWASVIPAYVLSPLRIVEGNGGPAVKVRLENKADAYLALDTGLSGCVLSSSMARTLGLTPQPYKGGTNTPSNLKYVPLNHVQFGRADFEGAFVVLDNDKGRVDDQPVEGVIGCSLFSECAVVFDFEQNQLILIPGGKLSDSQRAALGFGKTTRVSGTTVEKDYNDRLYVPLSVTLSPEESVKDQVLLDTGKYHTIVGNTAKLRAKPFVNLKMRKATGDIDFPVHKAQAAQVGEAKIEPFFSGITSNPREKPSLGMDFLSRFRVLLDFPAGEVYLAPVPSRAHFPTLAARVNAAQQFGQVIYEPTEQGEWRVKRVDALAEGGEAELRPGDIVREINGRKTSGLPTDEFKTLFLQAKTLKLSLLRDGKDVAVTISVKK